MDELQVVNRINRHLKSRERLLIIFFLALTVRLILGVQYGLLDRPFAVDEPIYVKAGKLYVNHFLEGHRGFDECLQFNQGVPMFAKLLYGLSILGLGPIIGETFAGRLVGILFGALTCVTVYSLGKRIGGFNFGLFCSLVLSFHSFFIRNNLAVMLDGPCVFFMLLSVLFFYDFFTLSKLRFFLLSGFSLGLAVASKYFGLLTVPIILLLLMPKIGRNKKWILTFIILVLMGALIFIIVQPRMWYSPVTLITTTWEHVYRHNVSGHPVPAMLITGDPSMPGRVLPPWWTMTYWMVMQGSVFEFVGIIALMIMIFSFRKKSSLERSLPFYLLGIPLAYFTLQPLKLPHYMTIIIPGFVLAISYGYNELVKKFNSEQYGEFNVLLKGLILVLLGLHIIEGIFFLVRPYYYDINLLSINLFFSVLMVTILLMMKVRGKWIVRPF